MAAPKAVATPAILRTTSNTAKPLRYPPFVAAGLTTTGTALLLLEPPGGAAKSGAFPFLSFGVSTMLTADVSPSILSSRERERDERDRDIYECMYMYMQRER